MRFEFWQAEFLVNILPAHLHIHVTPDLLRIATDNIAQEPRTLLQLDAGGYVREIIGKGLVIGDMIDNKGVNLSFAAGRYPLCFFRIARRAEDGGRPPDMAAATAFLKS